MKIKSRMIHLNLECKAQVGNITADVLVMAFVSYDDIDFDPDEISLIKSNGVDISDPQKLFDYYKAIGVNLPDLLRQSALQSITSEDKQEMRRMFHNSI